ncbi:hypothetical protein [Streptomyces sp. NPDC058466]|uniref:hypothetical protein n=1 Tax=Streptomyces sp. NPDC058466 TaxID=3346512 RepID=UPI00365A0621
MARYTINYLTGDTETVEADGVEYDADAGDYTFVVGRQAVALAPVINVRSVHRQDDTNEAIAYPHQDGGVTVLGPEVFASADGDAISWRGENYTRNPRNLFGKAVG